MSDLSHESDPPTIASDRDARDLAEEQAALRRVATLVAGQATPAEVFATVAKEAAQTLKVAMVSIVRYEPHSTAVQVGAWEVDRLFALGTSWPIDELSISGRVFASGEPARVDEYAEVPGEIAAGLAGAGIHASVGAPIVVEGVLWGVIMALSTERMPLPEDTEVRLARFTDLVAMAIANAQARDDLRRIADEQTALREVATRVAEGAAADEVFGAVAEQVARVLSVPMIGIARYEPDGTSTVIGAWGSDDEPFVAGTRLPPHPGMWAEVRRTGRPARVDSYAELAGTISAQLQAAGVVGGISVPIVVDGRTWGVMSALSTEQQTRHEDLEPRLARFTDLLATAISNTQARDDLHQLADEQAALRRVATLVARQATPREVFDAVAEELAHVLALPSAGLMRYEPDGTAVLIGAWGSTNPYPIGYCWPPHPGVVASVLATGEPARVDDYAALTDAVSAESVAHGIRSGIGAPVIVDGGIWGVVMTVGPAPLPAGMENRLAAFTELVATAISNATNHSQLVTSRARIVAAGDEARRRIERDLHDGTQQRLVSIGLDLENLKAAIPSGAEGFSAEVNRIQDEVTSVMEDVREISRGLHPSLLSQVGLAASLESLARKSPVPADLDVRLECRLPQQLEIATYYVVSEALANSTKHASPSVVEVRVQIVGERLLAVIRDDGVGGADMRGGSGLIGLADRVEALGGRFSLVSAEGQGTTISVDLPLAPEPEVHRVSAAAETAASPSARPSGLGESS